MFKQGLNKHNCPKINRSVFNSHRKKILEEKCLIISILCAKILCELALMTSQIFHFLNLCPFVYQANCIAILKHQNP